MVQPEDEEDGAAVDIILRKGDQTMSNNNYDAFRTFIEGRFGFGGAEHEERGTEGAFY